MLQTNLCSQKVNPAMQALLWSGGQKVRGILLQLDFRKADTVEWPVIQQTLSKFNFGDSIKRWVQTFYCNAESSILNNGLNTKQISLSRGH